MQYSDYQNTRDLAWKILLDCQVRALPVRTSAICKKLGIPVHLYEPADDNDGMSFIANGTAQILVSARQPRPRQRFTVAHEMGHILLGHVGQYALVNREPDFTDNPIEIQANIFAARLLAPACVLWGCGVRSAWDIMRLCDISRTAAEYRMERMQTLYKRGKFLASPLERQVYAQFYDYISAVRSHRQAREAD